MATHSSILAWKISWTEKPGGLQSMGSLRVGHNRGTNNKRACGAMKSKCLWGLSGHSSDLIECVSELGEVGKVFSSQFLATYLGACWGVGKSCPQHPGQGECFMLLLLLLSCFILVRLYVTP